MRNHDEIKHVYKLFVMDSHERRLAAMDRRQVSPWRLLKSAASRWTDLVEGSVSPRRLLKSERRASQLTELVEGSVSEIHVSLDTISRGLQQPRRQRRERVDYIEFGSVNSTVSQPKHLKRLKQDICMTESVICSHQLSTHLSNLSFTS